MIIAKYFRKLNFIFIFFIVILQFSITACNPHGSHMQLPDQPNNPQLNSAGNSLPNNQTPQNSGGTGGQVKINTGPFFKTDIMPILEKNCLACHGPGSGRDWTNYETFKSKKEILKVRVIGPNANMPMGKRLAPGEISILQAWIDNGMAYEASDKVTEQNNTPSVAQTPAPQPPINPPAVNPANPTQPAQPPQPGQQPGVPLPPTVVDNNPPPSLGTDATPVQVQSCLGCHGEKGQSLSPMFPKLAAQPADYLINQLNAFKNKTRASDEAKNFMWSITESLTDADISIIANYFSTQSGGAKNPIGDLTAISNGEAIYKNGIPEIGLLACALCHGSEAQGQATMARLAGQHKDYLAKQLFYFKTDVRKDEGAMSPFSKLMSTEQMNDVSEYLNSL